MISILYYISIPIYVIVCFFLIAVVLLQQGKGADLAGAFGGGGTQTAFGARGATTLLHRLTTWAFVIFVVLSMSLSVLQAMRRGQSVVSEEAPAATPAPAAPATGTPSETPAPIDAAPTPVAPAPSAPPQ